MGPGLRRDKVTKSGSTRTIIETQDHTKEERAMRFDVVTIGGGLSGLVTACRAAQLGQRVAVLEQGSEERYLCSSRWSTGVVNIMGLAILADPAQLEAAIIEGSGGTARPDLARTMAQNGKRAIEWLGAQGARFI